MNLRFEAGRLVKRAGAIIATAKTAGRELTPAECAEVDSIHAQADSLLRQAELDEGFTRPLERPAERLVPAMDPGNQASGSENRAAAQPVRDPKFDRLVRSICLGTKSEERAVMLTQDQDIGGGFFGTTITAELIDKLRNASVVLQAGGRQVSLQNSAAQWPVTLTDPTVSWVNEGQAFTSSTPTFGLVNLRAISVGCLIPITKELLEDVGSILPDVQGIATKAIAESIDGMALAGSGVGQPLGILSAPDIASTALGTSDGAAITGYDEIGATITTLRSANVSAPLSLVWHPRTEGAVDALKDGDQNPL